MYSGKFFTSLKQQATKKFLQAAEVLHNLEDPEVGAHLVNLQRPQLLVRVDGRCHINFQQQDGLIVRNHPDRIVSLRQTDVEQYQISNKNPFAWGACPTMAQLEYFLVRNEVQTAKSWIHAFYGNATCLSTLKEQANIPPNGFDKECELLVIQHISFNQWLASIDPQYRDKLLDGSSVPNAIADLNENLPRTLRKEDLDTEENMLGWLLINNSEEAFAALSRHLYTGVSSEVVSRRCNGNTWLVDAIEHTLSENNTSQFRM